MYVKTTDFQVEESLLPEGMTQAEFVGKFAKVSKKFLDEFPMTFQQEDVNLVLLYNMNRKELLQEVQDLRKLTQKEAIANLSNMQLHYEDVERRKDMYMDAMARLDDLTRKHTNLERMFRSVDGHTMHGLKADIRTLLEEIKTLKYRIGYLKNWISILTNFIERKVHVIKRWNFTIDMINRKDITRKW